MVFECWVGGEVIDLGRELGVLVLFLCFFVGRDVEERLLWIMGIGLKSCDCMFGVLFWFGWWGGVGDLIFFILGIGFGGDLGVVEGWLGFWGLFLLDGLWDFWEDFFGGGFGGGGGSFCLFLWFSVVDFFVLWIVELEDDEVRDFLMVGKFWGLDVDVLVLLKLLVWCLVIGGLVRVGLW